MCSSNESIEDGFERDTRRFGYRGRKLGFDGSVALRGTASSGNSDDAFLGIGLKSSATTKASTAMAFN